MRSIGQFFAYCCVVIVLLQLFSLAFSWNSVPSDASANWGWQALSQGAAWWDSEPGPARNSTAVILTSVQASEFVHGCWQRGERSAALTFLAMLPTEQRQQIVQQLPAHESSVREAILGAVDAASRERR